MIYTGNPMDYTGKKAFITGGSSGIGLALARQLARLGADVWIAARDPARLDAACHEISAERRSDRQQVKAVILDVSSRAQVLDVAGRWEVENGSPDLLVNCAGVVHPGYFEDLDLERFEWMNQINYLGAVYLTKAFIHGMIARRSGQIVNVCSAGGLIGFFGDTAYSGSKFALRGFSDALRMEMKPHGIAVSIVYPPDTDTPQLAYENQFKPYETKMIVGANLKGTDADTVARSIIRGVQKKKYSIFPTFDTWFVYWLSRFLGEATFTVLDYMVKDARRKHAKTTR
jgi:3-dehydrosphinganine reductase